MWTAICYLASPKFLADLLAGGFSTSRFDSRVHGGRFFTHSVKSPLTTLQVCLSELEQISSANQSSAQDSAVKKYLASAVVATRQISSLVEVATRRDPYERAHAVEVKEFFCHLQTLFGHLGKNTKLIFSINLATGKEVVKMNKYFFFELMQCLLNNAIESYAKNAKQKLVLVTALVKNKRLEIQVQDFGQGTNYLATKLMTIKGFTTKGDGHGFGLWFAKEVIENQGKGKLKIYSEKGLGTTVRFSLPLS